MSRSATSAALAAIVVAGVLWFFWPENEPVGDAGAHGRELVAVSPAGSANTLEFTWNSPIAAANYRLVIRDSSGTIVYSGETTESSINIDTTARPKFATMVEYAWTVSALDASGQVMAESKPRTFTYQP